MNIQELATSVVPVSYTHLDVYKRQYDADLVAIESLTGFVREWIAFTKKHENLTIEIRTKSGRCDSVSYTHLDVYKRQVHSNRQ